LTIVPLCVSFPEADLRGALRPEGKPMAIQPYEEFECSHDQKVGLHLAGTVGIPAPFPATGVLIAHLSEPVPKPAPSQIQLEIIHRLSYRVRMTRWVPLTAVRAILGPDEEPWAKPARGMAIPPLAVFPQEGWTMRVAEEYRSPPQGDPVPEGFEALIVNLLTVPEGQRPKASVTVSRQAIVFVAESEPIRMVIEAAMTAAESAQYHPPLVAVPEGMYCSKVTRV
jgi:hypothetical protein